MFNKKRVLRSILILALCATVSWYNQPKKPTYEPILINCDAVLRPYFDMYILFLEENNIQWDNKQKIDIKMSLSLYNTNILGIAKGMYFDDGVVIFISPKFLDLDESDRLWVFYHEMTHDIFNVKHNETEIMRGYHTKVNMLDFLVARQQLISYLKENCNVDIQRK